MVERFPDTSTRLPINAGARVSHSLAGTSVHPESPAADAPVCGAGTSWASTGGAATAGVATPPPARDSDETSIICNAGPAPTITTTPRTKTPSHVRTHPFLAIHETYSLLIWSNNTIARICLRICPLIAPLFVKLLRGSRRGSVERSPDSSTRLPINPGARVRQSLAGTSVHPVSAAAELPVCAAGALGAISADSAKAEAESCRAAANATAE